MSSCHSVARAQDRTMGSQPGAGFGKPARRQRQRTHLDTSVTSIAAVFWRNVEVRAEDPALRWRDGRRWQTLSWRGYGDAVRRVSSRLIELGVESGDRVGILSANRWEWHVSDLAVLSVGGVTVPIYQTNAAGQVARALSHSESRLCFIDGADQLAKILLRRNDLPGLEHVCSFDGVDGLDDTFVLDASDWFDPALATKGPPSGTLDARIRAIRPDDLATLVYTSGTVGPPKATMLSHRNILATLRNVTSVVPVGPDDRFLSFLPLSHIAERSVSHFGQVVSGGQTWFAQSLASVPEDLRACRPTIFFAVPRVWEKLREGIIESFHGQPLPVRAVAERYLELAERGDAESTDSAARSTAEQLELLALQPVFRRLIRHRMGLGDAHFLVSGVAPIAQGLLEWFARLVSHRGGLRADGGLRGHHAEPAGCDPDRNRRASGAERGDPSRGRR